VFDGHGCVRGLTNSIGAITDTYDYDAFGNLIHSTCTTPNNYLFAGEQFDVRPRPRPLLQPCQIPQHQYRQVLDNG
jgi:hypothetical protein